MKNKFIGNTNSIFNKELLDNLETKNINIISFIDLDFNIDIEDLKKEKEPIILFPIIDNHDSLNYNTISWKLLIDSAFYDWGGTSTSIFVVYPNKIGTKPFDISKIINNLDRVSLVDNIWVWPRIENDLQLRDQSIENLYFQKIKNAN